MEGNTSEAEQIPNMKETLLHKFQRYDQKEELHYLHSTCYNSLSMYNVSVSSDLDPITPIYISCKSAHIPIESNYALMNK